MRIAGTWCCAPLFAVLLCGGCVNDVPVQPEAVNLSWDRVAFPGQHRTGCLAIDPDGRIFLGAYDYERDVTIEIGVAYVSSDNGESWERRVLGTQTARHLATDSEGRVFAAPWSELLRSVDHGDTWKSLKRLHDQYIVSLVIDAGDNIYLPTEEHGIYFSGNHGDSLTQIGQGIVAAGELRSLAVDSKGCLFAVAGYKLFESCDRGASWTEAPNVPWGDYINQVAIDRGDRIFAAHGETLYRSTDGGESWTALDPPGNYSVDRIAIDKQDRLYCLIGFRAYVSSDGGDSWSLMAALWSSQIEHLASNPGGDVFLLGDWGLSRSIDNGASWEMLGFTEFEPVDIAIGGDGTHYVAMECGGIYRSIGDPGNWELYVKGLPDVRINSLVGAGDSTLIACTRNGVYISPEDGAAWSLAWLEGINIKQMLLLPADSAAAITNAGVILFAGGGGAWNDIGLKGYEIKALARTGDGRLFAGANFGGVFRYTGTGILWDQMNEGLGDLRVNALAVASGGAVLAGTNTGIFVSSNGGASWSRFSNEQIAVTTMLVVGEDIMIGSTSGVFWTRIGWGALVPQNDGLSRSDRSDVRSIEADSGGRLFLWTGNDFFRSSLSTKDLVPAGR
jgi:photosystem II stability/assembly factor-like uncharacterized protein